MGSKVTPVSVAEDIGKGLVGAAKKMVNIGGQLAQGTGIAAEMAGKFITDHTGGSPMRNPLYKESAPLSQKGSLGGSHARPDYTSHKK
jgi:hypothetical protein